MAERIQNTSPHIEWTASSHPDGEALAGLETKLTPYLTLGGIDYYSKTLHPALAGPVDTIDDTSSPDPIYRFAVGVVPLQDIDAPNDGSNKWLLNLDTEQLYTGPRTSSSSKGFFFGEKYVSGAATADAACFEKYTTGDEKGAYASPTPVLGAPVEFRKIYFRGHPVSSGGKLEGCPESSGVNTYYAYFACSQPVQQDCMGSGASDSGCAYNPRNETYGLQDGTLTNWEDFDIGAGEGGINSINFESDGCLPSPTIDYETATVIYSLTRADILSCLGYTEQCIGLCIDGSITSGCILFDSSEYSCCSG